MVEESKFFAIARQIRPHLNTLQGNNLTGEFMETMMVLWMTPFAVISLIWLAAITDFRVIQENVFPLILLQIALIITAQHTFSISIELDTGMDVGPISSLSVLISWSAVLILGPEALWLSVVTAVISNITLINRLRRYKTSSLWSAWSLFLQEIVSALMALIALQVYTAVGGSFPFSGLTVNTWLPVLLATLLLSVLPFTFLLPIARLIGRFTGSSGFPPGFWLGVLVFTLIPAPFAILGAILYAQASWQPFFFFILGIMLVNYLAHHLSQAHRQSQRQSREMARLEALGEALLESPADASTLSAVLENHLPKLFPQDRLEVVIFEEAKEVGLPNFHQIHPAHFTPVAADTWERIRSSKEHYHIERAKNPSKSNVDFGDAIGAKITVSQTEDEPGNEQCLGGVYLMRHDLTGPVKPSLTAVQTLASQIGTALYRAQVYAETMAHQKIAQELEFAGRIQASFLPKQVPDLAGWQIAATIEPARQTSGDFYDFIPLGEGKLGILVADVADKGTGAALYMALSRTLIRTYAMENGERPELALAEANERILADTESDQFVTVFYGILDRETGQLTYANAGHNPGYLLRRNGNGQIIDQTSALIRTGIPLGMFPDMAWEQKQEMINPGDLLFLYSDGVTEAQNEAGDLFEDERLLAVGRDRNGRSAQEIQTAVLDSIHAFVGDAPQFDDITLLVVTRE